MSKIYDLYATAIRIDCVIEEPFIIAGAPCPCGGKYKSERQSVIEPSGRPNQHFDVIDVRCGRCLATREFVFDVTSCLGTVPHELPAPLRLEIAGAAADLDRRLKLVGKD